VIWRRAVNKLRPAVVLVISGGWDLFDVQEPGTTKWLVPGTPAWARYYKASLERVIAILSSRGAHVVIPTMPYYGSMGLIADRDDKSRSAFNPRRVDSANAVLAQVAASAGDKVSTPDLNRFLAPAGRYQNSLLGVSPVRYDGTHFTPAGSNLVGAFLAPHLKSWLNRRAPAPAAAPDSSPAP
jgi:hypothetical protein